jgi:hypothetical protein
MCHATVKNGATARPVVCDTGVGLYCGEGVGLGRTALVKHTESPDGEEEEARGRAHESGGS